MGRRNKRKQGKFASMAKSADKYALYEASVQEPEADIDLIERIFKKRRGRKPRSMREDFGGTAVFACEWVRRHEKNEAWAIDLDPVPLDYCRQHHLPKLSSEERERVHLIEANVLDDPTDGVDVTVAFNFSYMCFHTRDVLRAYFEKARSTLGPDGVFMLDIYGGGEAFRTMTEEREQEGFDYVWDQNKVDPISHRVLNYIHFEFPDGSRLKRAFTYDWRLWTIPELRELLEEAGFAESAVYWEGTDEDGEGNGEYRKVKRAPDDPAFVSYVVAWP